MNAWIIARKIILHWRISLQLKHLSSYSSLESLPLTMCSPVLHRHKLTPVNLYLTIYNMPLTQLHRRIVIVIKSTNPWIKVSYSYAELFLVYVCKDQLLWVFTILGIGRSINISNKDFEYSDFVLDKQRYKSFVLTLDLSSEPRPPCIRCVPLHSFDIHRDLPLLWTLCCSGVRRFARYTTPDSV